MRSRLCSLVTAASVPLLGALAGTAGSATAPTGPPTAVGSGGAVATVETLATQAAVETLRRGGNAVDAAVTAAEPLFRASPVAAALEARGHVFVTNPEIGAATGIEFLPGGGVLAAAQPTRRGGGSAMVEVPSG
jgi:gamma-glutamyltranspeptidase